MPSVYHRSRGIEQDDASLLAECEVDVYRASGPGGQKRNKTSSAVRLRHLPTGLAAQATESRSQHENRARAIRRLRAELALELRSEPSLGPEPVPLVLSACLLELVRSSPRRGRRAQDEPRYLVGIAEVLDIFCALELSVADTAAALQMTTGALSRILTGDDRVLQKVNELRSARSLRPLRPR